MAFRNQSRNGNSVSGGLPKDLLASIKSTHQNTQLHGKGRHGHKKERKRLLKGVGQSKKPWEIARGRKHQAKPKAQDFSDDESDEDLGANGEFEGDEEFESERDEAPSKSKKKRPEKDESANPLKSILKKTTKFPIPESDSADPLAEGPARPISRAVKEALDEDDAKIAALEKKLGIKGRKLPKTFEDDGLGDLLDGLDGPADLTSAKRKRDEYDDYLSSKRKRAMPRGDESEEETEDEELLDLQNMEDSDLDEEFEGESDGGMLAGDGDHYSEEEFQGFSTDVSQEKTPPKVRENPYRPPIAAETNGTGKYIPPSMRGPPSSDTEALTQCRRQLQGLLNRLSEANLLSILKDVEQVYNSNARQHVTSTLIELLMGLLCDRTSLMDTFIILHAGFIAAVYRVIGAHFGAQILERLVGDFDRLYVEQRALESSTKETTNLFALLAELYTFQVVNSNIIFDCIRFLLQEVSDLNTELLLKLIKNCGPQLRQDDPTALKDIILLLHKAITDVGEKNLSVRTKFMIETIDNLKNNRQKNGIVASQVATEHVIRMKKTLGTLNNRNIKASEPLGISLKDIRSSGKKGKWWLVGASWKDEATNGDESRPSTTAKSTRKDSDARNGEEGDPTDLFAIAKTLRINTDVRRAIFMAIMSASDYKDAHVRLLKLGLKRSQEPEISRVLLLLAGAEQTYNPYYALVARKFCADKKFKMAFQFGLWNLFKRMGEKGNLDDGEGADEAEEDIDLRKILSLAKFYGTLVADSVLPISILKVLEIPLLQPNTRIFLEVMLVTVFTRAAKQQSAVSGIIMEASTLPTLARSLQHFLKEVVVPSDLASTKKEKKAVKLGCKEALHALRGAEVVHPAMDLDSD
jgi:nucleolar MIF4G domain-containing protein 1